MTWSWEYLPSAEHVTGGAPTDFLASVEHRAAELVRAAEALYLDGTSYQGSGEPMRYLDVAGGLIAYYVVPRLELVVVCQGHRWHPDGSPAQTAWPAGRN